MKMKEELVLAIAAGCCFGLAALMTKIAVPAEFSPSSIDDWKEFIFNLPFLGLVIFNVLGVIFMWWGFSYGRVAIISPICSAFNVIIPVIGAVMILYESVSVIRGLGIAAVTAGTMILSRRG